MEHLKSITNLVFTEMGTNSADVLAPAALIFSTLRHIFLS
jgi:hypothetical protein